MHTIVYILPYLEKGGTETHVLELIKGFIQKNYKIILIAPRGSRLVDFQKYDITFIPFINLNKNLYKGISSFIRALKEIEKIKPKIIHIHGAHELIIMVNYIIKEVPIIFTVHGYHGNFSSISYKTSSIINNLLADATITVSGNEKNTMIKSGLKNTKCHLIYNGISTPKKTSQHNISSYIKDINKKKKIIAYIGRLEKEKGISYLLKALRLLNKKNCHLLIIGSGKLEKILKKEANRLSIKNITFTGFIDNVHDYLKIIDILIVPSLHEPFGLVCIEAMAHKIPVIGSAVGGISEIVQNNKTGFLVPAANPESIAKKIQLLINNNELAHIMGRAGYKRYKEHFTLETMISRTEMIYKKFI